MQPSSPEEEWGRSEMRRLEAEAIGKQNAVSLHNSEVSLRESKAAHFNVLRIHCFEKQGLTMLRLPKLKAKTGKSFNFNPNDK